MIKPETIAEILSLYRKHDWTLRRVLLSDELRVHLTDRLQDLFGGAEIVSARVTVCGFRVRREIRAKPGSCGV
jgi:hypothetical protein